jgi:hypothetical protein
LEEFKNNIINKSIELIMQKQKKITFINFEKNINIKETNSPILLKK